VFYFRDGYKCYLYRAVNQYEHTVDMRLRDKQDRASAEAFFRRAVNRTTTAPHTAVGNHRHEYTKAVAAVVPFACHIGTGLHGAKGERRRNPLSGVMSPPVTASRGTRAEDHRGRAPLSGML